ncbi:MAG: hypothetical protein AAGG02_13350 [Cyanobacteria bacterium P01_H01_bin.15]
MEPPSQPTHLLEAKGPWPFITHRAYEDSEHHRIVWRSRNHRKGLTVESTFRIGLVGPLIHRCLWMPQELNWWIGGIFAVGSALFALGSVLVLDSALAQRYALSETAVNAVFLSAPFPLQRLPIYNSSKLPMPRHLFQ